MNLNEA